MPNSYRNNPYHGDDQELFSEGLDRTFEEGSGYVGYAEYRARQEADSALANAQEALQVARSSQSIVNDLVEKNKPYEAEFKKTVRKYEDLSKEVTASRNKNLETLAVFVALFTFASLSFQMFANADKTLWLPLGMLMLGGLMLFSFVVLVVSSMKIDSRWRRIWAPLLLLGVGAGLIGLGGLFYDRALTQKDETYSKCAQHAVSLIERDDKENVDHKIETELYAQLCRR